MEKINVAELLKDCPRGMELDCTMYDNLYFDSLNADYYGTINCYTLIDGIRTSINFTKYGTFNNHAGAKCVIFPKGKTTWEGFVPPCKFKDRDIIFTRTSDYAWVSMFKKFSENRCCTYIDMCIDDNDLFTNSPSLCTIEEIITQRLVTEEEKQKLFRAIKDNGYKWNEETKTLKKLVQPKFKAGDRIRNKETLDIFRITNIDEDSYHCGLNYIWIVNQDEYELVPNKFDIHTLVPFESKVLVRDNKLQKWSPAIWGFYDSDSQDYQYKLVGVLLVTVSPTSIMNTCLVLLTIVMNTLRLGNDGKRD